MPNFPTRIKKQKSLYHYHKHFLWKILDISKRQHIKIKGTGILKERITVSIFDTDIISCLENPIKTTGKLLRIRAFNKVTANTKQKIKNIFIHKYNGGNILFIIFKEKENIKK